MPFHTDTLSRLNFNIQNVETKDSCEDRILHWVETDVLSFRWIKFETDQDPILKRILNRIWNNVWSNCSMGERPFKEASYRLTIERSDPIVPP